MTPSKRKNLKGTFDDARDDADETDAFEEADEFEDVEMADLDDALGAENDAEDSLESLDDSDLDNSEDEAGSESSDGASGEDNLDSDEEMARHEAAVAAGIAAAERKALRKAERWAAAVDATPASRNATPSGTVVPGQTRVSTKKNASVSRSILSPSKHVLWNLKRNTRHTPTGPPNPVRGDGLRALLNTTPRKSLLRPIHARRSDRGRHRRVGRPAKGERKRCEERKKETMTPRRKKVRTSTFF